MMPTTTAERGPMTTMTESQMWDRSCALHRQIQELETERHELECGFFASRLDERPDLREIVNRVEAKVQESLGYRHHIAVHRVDDEHEDRPPCVLISGEFLTVVKLRFTEDALEAARLLEDAFRRVGLLDQPLSDDPKAMFYIVGWDIWLDDQLSFEWEVRGKFRIEVAAA